MVALSKPALSPWPTASFPYHTVHTQPVHASSARNPPNTQGLGLHPLAAPFTLSYVFPGKKLAWVLDTGSGPVGLGVFGS